MTMWDRPIFHRIWSHRNGLTFGLWVLFIISSFLMVKSSSDPLIGQLRGAIWASLLSQFPTGNQVIFDTTAGINVSLFIYVLVAWLPERRKRSRIRRNLALHYNSFKEQCIHILIDAMGGAFDSDYLDLVARLKNDQSYFREYFNAASSKPGQSRWDAVLNGLDEYYLRRLATEFEILMREIQFTFSAIDVDESEAFALLKRLTQTLHRTKTLSSDYDEVKQICRFLWSVLTGWDFVTGYPEKDVIAETIESI